MSKTMIETAMKKNMADKMGKDNDFGSFKRDTSKEQNKKDKVKKLMKQMKKKAY